MYVIVPITHNGAPALGLSPLITIRDVATTLAVVTSDPMVEVGDGFYKYNFTGYQPNKNYAISIDGGPTLAPGERYAFAGNESFYEDFQSALTGERGGYIA